MRTFLLPGLLFLCLSLPAQQGVSVDPREELLPIEPCTLRTELPRSLGPVDTRPLSRPVSRAPAPYARSVSPGEASGFDFAATKPYLAFFCRLELDIESATRFPVRFRLGEVRTWQQELSKRD